MGGTRHGEGAGLGRIGCEGQVSANPNRVGWVWTQKRLVSRTWKALQVRLSPSPAPAPAPRAPLLSQPGGRRLYGWRSQDCYGLPGIRRRGESWPVRRGLHPGMWGPCGRWPCSPSFGPCLLLLLVLGCARTLRSVGSRGWGQAESRRGSGAWWPLRRILMEPWVWSVFRNFFLKIEEQNILLVPSIFFGPPSLQLSSPAPLPQFC